MSRLIPVLVIVALVGACQQPAPVVEETPPPDLLSTVTSARVVELNFVWDNDAPLLELNPPFSMALRSTHAGTAGMMPGGIAFADEVMEFSGQHGAPTIDALGHISSDGQLFGGLDAAEHEGPEGLQALGIEHYPSEKFVNRGVLLDVARQMGVEALDPGYEITPADLEATVAAQGVELRAATRSSSGRATASTSTETLRSTWASGPVSGRVAPSGSPNATRFSPAWTR